MGETIFPPSPNYCLSKVLSTREDGSVVYGSQKELLILIQIDNKMKTHLISDVHSEKITSVAFSPWTDNEKFKNTVLSSSDDGFVKLSNIATAMPFMGHNSHMEPQAKAPVKVVCASWSRCNLQYIVSAGENDTVVLWDIVVNTTLKFSFPKLKPSVVDCSYHDEKIVAVGSKSGLVYIIKLTKKGEVLYKLRGHDKEVQALSWCPTLTAVDNCDIFKEYLLASSCQEKEICIWRAIDGVCESIIQLPKCPISKERSYYARGESTVNFVPIFWADSYVLYSGTMYGELIYCDLKQLFLAAENENMTSKQMNKKILNSWKCVHNHHSNLLFAIASNVWSRTDRRESSSGVDNKMNTMIWTIGKDQKLVGVHENSNNAAFSLHTLNGHPFEAAVSPHDPNLVAVAAGDAKIRLWNVTKSSGYSNTYWQKINDRVYSVSWHPNKEGLLAYGTSEGRVGLKEMYSRKEPFVFKIRHLGKVYRVSWGPEFSETENKDKFSLYSIGGHKLLLHDPTKVNSETVNLTNLINVPYKMFRDLCWKSDYSVMALGCKTGVVYLLARPNLKLIHTVSSMQENIQSLTWHPPTTTFDTDCSSLQGYFTFGSAAKETTIKVFNYVSGESGCTVEQVAALKGHTGYIQSVSWSPHFGRRLISAAADFTVRIWDVAAHTQLAEFVVSHTILPLFCLWSPVDPDVVITGCSARILISWNTTTNGTHAIIQDQKVKKGRKIQMSDLLNESENPGAANEDRSKNELQPEKNALLMAKTTEAHKAGKENKILTKAWNSETDSLQRCYVILKGDAGDEDFPPFLRSNSKFMEYLGVEAESHEKSNTWSGYYQLAMWRGNINEVIAEKIKTGHLDDFLISLAPFVSPMLWKEACASYAKSLTDKKQYRKAACYLLAIHKVREAIALLADADLYLDAICVARSRLPAHDPLISELIRKYSDSLTETGSFLKSCECLLYLKDYSEAARVLRKKTSPEYANLAVLAAKKAGSLVVDFEYIYNALVLCLESSNWQLASQICSDHNDVKELSIFYTVFHVIHQLDLGDFILDEPLITYLNKIPAVKGDAAYYARLEFTYDRNALYTEKKKLYETVARELSLACCTAEKEVALVHTLRAVNAASRFTKKLKDEAQPLYKLCSWLSPGGLLKEESIFFRDSSNTSPMVTSLRAFLCQAIAEHVITNVNEDSTLLLRTLEELVDDVFNREAFTYHKNQVEVKLSERRMNEACQRKFQAAREKSESKSVGENKDGVGVDGPDKIGTSQDNTSLDEQCNPLGNSEDDIITRERDKVSQLSKSIQAFESTRIAAPSPAVVYCVLKQVSHSFPDSDCSFLETVEEKWKRLLEEDS